jgi:hypothetical protein
MACRWLGVHERCVAGAAGAAGRGVEEHGDDEEAAVGEEDMVRRGGRVGVVSIQDPGTTTTNRVTPEFSPILNAECKLCRGARAVLSRFTESTAHLESACNFGLSNSSRTCAKWLRMT